jgi:hypothetical protein
MAPGSLLSNVDRNVAAVRPMPDIADDADEFCRATAENRAGPPPTGDGDVVSDADDDMLGNGLGGRDVGCSTMTESGPPPVRSLPAAVVYQTAGLMSVSSIDGIVTTVVVLCRAETPQLLLLPPLAAYR